MVRSHYDPPDQKSTDELSAFFVSSASGERLGQAADLHHHVLRLPTLDRGWLIQHSTRKGVNDFLTIRGPRAAQGRVSARIISAANKSRRGMRSIRTNSASEEW